MNYTIQEVKQILFSEFSEELNKSFKNLLENRHLYQKTEVEVKNSNSLKSFLETIKKVNGIERAKLMLMVEYNKKINGLWYTPEIEPPKSQIPSGEWFPVFSVDTIKASCENCDRLEPYNRESCRELLKDTSTQKTIQIFALIFQCQSCKSLPEVFLVRREGLKLILSGRSPMEIISVPKYIPKAQRSYFSDAIIANNSGKTLAGLFYLRVFIEQFAQSKANEDNLRADQLIEKYQESLPKEFKSSFPSLKDVYGKLSEAIHKAEESKDLFDSSIKDIDKHFDARRVHELE